MAAKKKTTTLVAIGEVVAPKSPKKKAAARTGRPRAFTKKLGDQICAEIAEGKSLRTVCKSPKMPDTSTVFRWLRIDEDFRKQYVRACEERVEALMEGALDIADDGSNDWMDVWNPRTQEYDRALDREHVERSNFASRLGSGSPAS